MWQAIISFFTALPEIISILKGVIDLIKKEGDRRKRREMAQRLRDGLQKAADEHDTSDLENLFRRGS